jgi:hypothetical protein
VDSVPHAGSTGYTGGDAASLAIAF